MRKLILEEWVSLDGFAEDQDGRLDFFPSTEENKYADEKELEFLETVDTVILGRKTYELFVDFWPNASVDTEIIADKLNSLQKVVFSGKLKEAPWGKWQPAIVNSGDAIAEIKKLKSEPGKDLVLWGSISLAQACINANLIDEYRLICVLFLWAEGSDLFPI